MNLLCLSELLREYIAGTEFESKTYFAGGCVRDYLMQGTTSEEPGDIDICIELRNGSMLLGEHLAMRQNGIITSSYSEFGTLKMIMQGVTLEFVTTRREVYRYPSRYPKVSFGSLRDDSLRRDFSINALLMDVCSMKVLDICGFGIQDLEHGTIRCIGNPITRFREDPLRMLRALRFALRFRFAYEDATWLAMKQCRDELSRLSHRLVNSEISKIQQFSSRDELTKAIGQLGWGEALFDYL